MQKTKKVPQRKCIACQERDSKKGLIRIVKNKEGQIFLDPIGKANGRGAYICEDVHCLEKAMKTKALEKTLKVSVDSEIFEKLKEKKIYVRYFNKPRIDNYLRITIGTDDEMDRLFKALEEIVK